MTPNRRDRDWPVPDAIHQIKIALVHGDETGTNLLAMSRDQISGEVTLEDRDGAVHLLRFLKFWFNLPSAVFITATNLLDRFLIKMKVQQRYLTCLVISCMNVASNLHHYNIDPKILVSISQSKCSVKDMDRMSEIIKQKLDLGNGKVLTNVLDYLNQFLDLLETVAHQFHIKSVSNVGLEKEELLCHLEVIMCDSQCASAKPAVIALALIQNEFERFMSCAISDTLSYHSFELLQLFTTVVDLQLICLIVPVEFTSCHKIIKDSLTSYDKHLKSLYRQNLLWRYSSRSLYTTRSAWKYFKALNTISEE